VSVTVRSFLDGESSLADDVRDGLTRPFKGLRPKHFYDASGADFVPEQFEQVAFFDREHEWIEMRAAPLSEPALARRQRASAGRRHAAGRAAARSRLRGKEAAQQPPQPLDGTDDDAAEHDRAVWPGLGEELDSIHALQAGGSTSRGDQDCLRKVCRSGRRTGWT
jgi:hypothetical protein